MSRVKLTQVDDSRTFTLTAELTYLASGQDVGAMLAALDSREQALALGTFAAIAAEWTHNGAEKQALHIGDDLAKWPHGAEMLRKIVAFYDDAKAGAK